MDFYNQPVTPKVRRKIISNRCKCSICGSIIESKHVHDFVQCACHNIFTDGGKEYIRRGYKNTDSIIDLTIYEEIPLTDEK